VYLSHNCSIVGVVFIILVFWCFGVCGDTSTPFLFNSFLRFEFRVIGVEF
jgi:hypothetical protein